MQPVGRLKIKILTFHKLNKDLYTRSWRSFKPTPPYYIISDGPVSSSATLHIINWFQIGMKRLPVQQALIVTGVR